MQSVSNSCAICLTKLQSPIATLTCLHQFHLSCIKSWVKENTSCPLCREEQTPKLVEAIHKTVCYCKACEPSPFFKDWLIDTEGNWRLTEYNHITGAARTLAIRIKPFDYNGSI